MTKETLLGGQAIIEGVLMKGKQHVVMSVRDEKGKIITKIEKLKKRGTLATFFLIRGITNLVDMLVIGTKALMWSANQQAEEEEQLGKHAIALTIITAMIFGLGLFVFLPYLLTVFVGVKEEAAPVLFNFVDSVIKLGILLLYLLAISLMQDVKTLFKYHGAEHKAVFCFEAGKKLIAANAKKFKTMHPRCGTSFLLIVILVSILVFSFIPSLVYGIFPGLVTVPFFLQKIVLFFVRLSFLPIVAGISYELLRLSAKFQDNVIFRAFVQPGLWLQKITTKEPTKKQLEVALFALQKLVKLEKAKPKDI